jgi:hypothetical protein
MQLWPPMRFQFTDADDVAAYGDGWWVWDEVAVSRLKGRELVALEEAVDMPLLTVLEGLRGRTTLANMAAMWIALHRGGHKVAWADFNPVVFATPWEPVPAAPLDSGAAPAPDSGSSTAPSTESVSS